MVEGLEALLMFDGSVAPVWGEGSKVQLIWGEEGRSYLEQS